MKCCRRCKFTEWPTSTFLSSIKKEKNETERGFSGAGAAKKENIEISKKFNF